MKKVFYFYGSCVSHAPSASWWLIGTISTLSTYVVALVVLLLFWLYGDKANKDEVMNTFTLVASIALVLAIPVAVLMCFIIVPFWQAFRMYQEKENELEKEKEKIAELAERLKPGLEILRETEWDPQRQYYRIRVRNLSGISCRFGVDLITLTPQVSELQLPVPLQITNHQPDEPMAQLPGGQTRPVDVLHYLGTNQIQIVGGRYQPVVSGSHYEFVLCVHSDHGVSICQTFVVEHDDRGGISFCTVVP
jgi:amino acid transporter